MRATLEDVRPLGPPAVLTKAAWAYTEVRRMILDGELEPAATVNQEELARQLTISITPLREALGRLEAEGFIVLKAHRTMMINGLSAQELDDLYCLRILLDPFAAGLAATTIDNAQAKRLQELVRVNFEQPPTEVMASNYEFHRARLLRFRERLAHADPGPAMGRHGTLPHFLDRSSRPRDSRGGARTYRHRPCCH